MQKGFFGNDRRGGVRILNGLPQKPRGVFFKIVLNLVIFTVVTIFLTSTILTFIFEKVLITQTNTLHKDGMSKLSYSLTIMNDLATTTLLKTYFDPDVSNVLLYPSPDLTEISLALEKLKSNRTISPFIHSIYAYNRKTDTYYIDSSLAANTIQQGSEFFDKEMQDIINDFPKYKQLKPILRKLQVEVNNWVKNVNLYTFMYYDATLETKELDNVVILNVAEEWLRNSIDSLDVAAGSTFIIDDQGKMVISSATHSMLEDISAESYIQHILESTNDSGFEVNDVDRTKSVISFFRYAPMGWTFVHITPYHSIVQKIQDIRYQIIKWVSILLACSIISSVLISQRMYKPVRTILMNMKLLQIETNSHKHTIKDDYLRSLLREETKQNLQQIQNSFDRINIRLLSNQQFVVFLLKIDRYQEFIGTYHFSDQKLLKYAITNIAEEVCSLKGRCEAFEMDDDHVIMIMQMHHSADRLLDEFERSKLAQNVQQAVKSHLRLSLSCTLDSGDDFSGISACYRNTVYAANYRMFHGHGSILFAKQVFDRKPEVMDYPLDKEKQLIEALHVGSLSLAVDLYHEIINSTCEYTYENYCFLMNRLAFTTNTIQNRLDKKTIFLSTHNNIKFLENLKQAETIRDVDHLFLSRFQEIIFKQEQKKGSKHAELIDKVIDIIHQQYADQNLSISSISEALNMSPAYLGRLFVKMELQTIPTLINSVRMEKAKELLLMTEASVQEVSRLTGFTNDTYFYRLFKKANGVTPNDFRYNQKVT